MLSTFQARQLFLVRSAWDNSVLPVDKITPTTKVLKRNDLSIYGFCPQRKNHFNKVRSTAFVHTLICSNRDSIYMLSCKWNCNVATEIYQKQRRHGLETQTQEEWKKEDDWTKNERATEKADVSVEQRINVTLGAFTWSLLVNLNCFKLRDQIVPLQWSDYLGVLLRYYDIDHLWPPALPYPYLPAITMVNLLAWLMELAVFLLMVQGAGRDEHRAIIFGHQSLNRCIT